MKLIFVIFASLLVSQAYAGIPAVFEGESEDLTLDECVEAAQCIAELLNEADFDDLDVTVILDLIMSLVDIVQGYLACQAILDDPPTRWQQIQHTTCMTLWSATSMVTALRIQRTVTEASENVRTAWYIVQNTCARGQPILPCIGHLIEDPDSTEVVPYLKENQN